MGLIRLLMYAVLGFVAYTLIRRTMAWQPGRSVPDSDPDEQVARLTQCPNCQVYVDMQSAVRRRSTGGEFLFCSDACATEYLEKHKA